MPQGHYTKRQKIEKNEDESMSDDGNDEPITCFDDDSDFVVLDEIGNEKSVEDLDNILDQVDKDMAESDKKLEVENKNGKIIDFFCSHL